MADLEQPFHNLNIEENVTQFIAGLPEPVQRRVEALRGLQAQHDELEEQYKQERADLERKYQDLYAPLYSERADVVTGTKAVPAKDAVPASNEEDKGIPEFWLHVLQRCDVTSESISEKDVEVLKYLKDITTETLTGEDQGFKLVFHFADNPFFTNKVLEKTYIMLDEDYEPVLEKAEGTTIDWSPGKNVTVKILKKKPKKGAKPTDKPQTKTEPVESFFNFFSPPQVPDDNEEMEESEMEELQTHIEADYEMGAVIRDRIIPNAVRWFTGEALADELGNILWNDEDDEEDDDDEDADDDDDAPPSGKGGVGAGKGGADQPQECKQQ